MSKARRTGNQDVVHKWTRHWQTKNNSYLRFLRNKYKTLAMLRFKWENFPVNEDIINGPKDIPMWIPEETLFDNSVATFFKMPGTEKYYCLPISRQSAVFDAYGRMVEWYPFSKGTDQFAIVLKGIKLNHENAVLIHDNITRINTRNIIDTFIDDIANLYQTSRMNINAQKNPFVVASTEETVLSDINTFYEMMENVPAIFKTTLGNNMEFFNGGITYTANEMRKTINDFDSDILQWLGINNIPIEKNERLNIPETTSNAEETNLNRENFIVPREDAIKKINDMFGLSVELKYFEEVQPRQNQLYNRPSYSGEKYKESKK